MMQMKLADGRESLAQWDTGRFLTVPDGISQVHFANKIYGRTEDVDVIDGQAQIPDYMLQSTNDLLAFGFVGTPENGYTKISRTFKVEKRPKPADYVFTKPEQITLQDLQDRIEEVEKNQDPDAIKDAVKDYLDKNPVEINETDPTVPDWAKQPQKPKYTADEVGAQPKGNYALKDEIPTVPQIPEYLPNPHPLTLSGAVSATYDGSAPVTVEIPEAVTPPAVAEIGQTIIVKAVDDTGKPTEWECANVGEIITVQETVLASGTVAAADIVKGMKLDTGLTVADMKKWKTFSFRYETTSEKICINFKFSNPAAPAYYTVLYYEWYKSMSAFFTWVDTEKTALRIDNATKNTLAPGMGSAMVANGWMNRFANANQVSQYIKHHMADNYKVMIENMADGVDADLKWEIRGILK